MNFGLILQYSLLELSIVYAIQQKRFINRQLFNVGSKYSLRGLRSRETTGTNILDETGIRHRCSPNKRIISHDAKRKFIKHFPEWHNNSLTSLHNILLCSQS